MNTFLFVLRTYPEIDHITPMIWKCLEKGDRAIAVFLEPYDYTRDYRIRFLTGYPRFQVLRLAGTWSRIRRVRHASMLFWNHYTLRSLFRRYRFAACFIGWGPGASPSGGKVSLVKQIRTKFLSPLRERLISAAIDSSIPVFCLPHGVHTNLNLGASLKEGDRLPYGNENCFSAFVVSTEIYRQHLYRHGDIDPELVQNWGSLRFCPQWIDILKEICPEASVPPKEDGQVRLIFFVPKWRNRVDKEQTTALIKSIAERRDVQLILKTHPRKGEAELEEALLRELLEHSNVYLAGDAHSPALIRDSDIVVDIGSSIAIDAVVRGKHLIYPEYLLENRLAFDEWGGCLICHNQSDVHGYLDRIVQGAQPQLPETEIEPLLRQVVYGGGDPFDVPEYYYARVKEYLPGTSPYRPTQVAHLSSGRAT